MSHIPGIMETVVRELPIKGDRKLRKHTWIAMSMAAWLGAMPAGAHDPPTHERELVEILEGLERGMRALERLGRREEIEVLRRVADDLRGELRAHRREGEPRRDDREREIAERQIETLRLALPALREERREEAIHIVELAIGARDHMIEGNGDRRMRERAPGRGQIIEVLGLAEGIYREYGHERRAARLDRLAAELWPPRERSRHRDRPPRELEEIEIMRMAIHGLLEAERRDAADLLERAVHARQVDMEGRRDREARNIRENAPELGAQVELLQMSAGLWTEFGQLERARAIRELAERMWAGREHPQRDERPRRDERRRGVPGHDNDVIDRLERFQRRLDDLQRALDDSRERMRQQRR